jgi:predicted ATPase
MYEIVRRGRVDGPRDVVAVRGHVESKGRYLGAFNAAISGQELVYNGLANQPGNQLDDALFTLAIPFLRQFVGDQTLPLGEYEVIEIRLQGTDVAQVVHGIQNGSVVYTDQFEAPAFFGQTVARQSARLRSLSVENFYGFGDGQTLPFGPLTVLIGANGAGKTTVLRALAVLSLAAKGTDPGSLQGANGRWRNVAHPNQPSRFGAHFEHPNMTYELELNKTEVSEFAVTKELLVSSDAKSGAIQLQRPIKDWPQLRQEVEPSGLIADIALPFSSVCALSHCTDDSRQPFAAPAQRCLEDTLVYRSWRFGTGEAIDETASDRPDDRLRRDGANLPVVLARILQFPKLKSEFETALREILPGVEEIRVQVRESTVRVGLTLFGEEFGLSEMSDGTQRWLQLLTVLLDPNPPAMVVFDEPELGLHPEMMPALATLLRNASQRTQVVIATHQPLLLDALARLDAEWSVAAFELTEAGVEISIPDRAEIEKNWLGKGEPPAGLGDVWARGALGGTRW